ncbi:MAG TPA: hypothetical protein VHU15_04125 [Stellaceae bacterium]|jgi:hypothetical protein|nr:hypothetical protein [Stellaceae bacterium]
MNARVSIAVIAVALLCGGGVNAACPPGETKGCAKLDLKKVDLNMVPEVSEQIVARERSAGAKKAGPPEAAAKDPYTGPTLGVSDRVRRAPVVGYHWSID